MRQSEAQQRRLAEQLAEMNMDLEQRVAVRPAEFEVPHDRESSRSVPLIAAAAMALEDRVA